MDTGLFTGSVPMSEAWHRFADFVDRVDELPVGMLVRRGCFTDPGDEVAAAYDAPFPSEASKAGARAFPPTRAADARRRGRGPRAGRSRRCATTAGRLLMLWGAEDRPLPPAQGEAFAAELGRPAPRLIEGAGHYLQEDQRRARSAP